MCINGKAISIQMVEPFRKWSAVESVHRKWGKTYTKHDITTAHRAPGGAKMINCCLTFSFDIGQ